MIRVTRRAQAAMEFLLTYGWALLALLGAIGILTYYTGYMPFIVPSSCRITQPITCIEYKAQAPTNAGENGTLYLSISPMSSITYAKVTVDCLRDGTAIATYTTSSYIQQTSRLNGSYLVLPCPMNGKVLRANINVDYTLYTESTVHTSLGTITTVVES